MKPFEIFRTGSWTSDKGISKEYTEADLDKIIENYNSDDPAPIVIGHPTTNAPAFGWIEKLQRVKDRLIAIPKQLNEQFVDLVKNGAFKKRSISITPEMKLVHVGFLGAAAPAVEGLKEIQFSLEDDLLSFSDEFIPEVIDDVKVEENDELKKVYKHSKDLKIKLADPLRRGDSEASDNPQQAPDPLRRGDSEASLKNFQAAINSLNSIVTDLKNNFSQLTDDEIKSLNKRLDELQFSMQVNEFETRLNEKLLYGSLTPAMKTKVMALVEFIQKNNFSNSNFSFSQYVSDIKAKLIEFVDAIPKLNLFDEFAKKPTSTLINTDEFENVNVDGDSLELHKKALQYMNSNEGVSYVEAINKLAP